MYRVQINTRKASPLPVKPQVLDDNRHLIGYELLWRKKTNKLHKTWEGDAVGHLKNVSANLTLEVQADGRKLATVRLDKQSLNDGDILTGSGYEFEVGSIITKKVEENISMPPQPTDIKPLNPVKKQRLSLHDLKPIRPASGGFRTPFTVPRLSSLSPGIKASRSKNEERSIDDQLLKYLRKHQIDGVNFVINCVLGRKHIYGNGCILADEMGLGKTLTSIAVIHTLLRHNDIKNALILCPVTLISNWKSEFSKWLPPTNNSQIGVLAVDQNGLGNNSLKNPAQMFFGDRQFKSYQVMIIGYERVRLMLPQIESLERRFDLVVCDEGHRLKSTNSKTAEAISQICEDKRVLLTGTPIQNDLSEFWALGQFVNPGIFGSEAQFNKKYSVPIASELSQDRKRDLAIEELTEICDEFMLRRDASIIEKYVNVPKTEYVVFCRPSERQAIKYRNAVSTVSADLFSDLESVIDRGFCLKAINDLRKIANGDAQDQGGKLKMLNEMLKNMNQASEEEKIVIVSGSTRMLDLCQNICVSNHFSWVRLDGSTPQDKRQSSVRKFNQSSPNACRAFLLSSRSGGMGLNLIGGSRLVLMDCDWNPAIDAQVMGRIHRDGQKKPCVIYRLITTGTIDEKIFQRQLSKINMSQHVLLSAGSTSTPDFSRETLKDLFSFTVPAKCNTIDTAKESVNIKGYVESADKTDSVLFNKSQMSDVISCLLVKDNSL